MARQATGASYPAVTDRTVKRAILPLPAVAKQQRIAAILDKADALRIKRRATLAHLDTLTQSIFLDMFGDPRRNSRKWPTTKLSLCTEVINDCPHTTPKWADRGVICLRTSNLTSGGWDWTDTRFVSEPDYFERSRRGAIRPGDIILSREGTVGVAAIVEPGMRVCMGQRLVQVRPKAHPTSEYLLHYLLYVLHPERIGQSLVGSTSQHLNVRELRNLLVPEPPPPLQSRFTKIVQALTVTAEFQRKSLLEFDTLFRSLQHRAFRNEL